MSFCFASFVVGVRGWSNAWLKLFAKKVRDTTFQLKSVCFVKGICACLAPVHFRMFMFVCTYIVGLNFEERVCVCVCVCVHMCVCVFVYASVCCTHLAYIYMCVYDVLVLH